MQCIAQIFNFFPWKLILLVFSVIQFSQQSMFSKIYTLLLTLFLIHNSATQQYFSNSQLSGLQNSTFTSSLNAIFFKVPSSREINQLIQDADIVSLLKVIQILGQQTSLKCYDVLTYFLEINGKLYSVLLEKQIELAKLQTIFEIAQQKIKELQSEIQRTNGWKRVLQLSNSKMELTQKLKNLTQLYNIHNQIDTSIKPQRAKIIGYQTQIKNIENTNDIQRHNLLEQQLRMAEIQANIEQLQKKLKQQKSNQDRSWKRITNLKKTINENQIKIKTIRNIIANYERHIDTLQNKVDNYRRSYEKAEVQAARLTKQINQIQRQEDQIGDYIRNLQQNIRKQQTKLEYHKINKLQFELNQLNSFIPNIEDAIQLQYVKCFNFNGNFMKIVKVNGKMLYIFTPNNFKVYMQTLYGSLSNITVSKPLLLSKVNITSPQWIDIYGNPSYSLQYLSNVNPNVSTQLVCIDVDNIKSNRGRITKLQKYRVEVRDKDNRIYYLIITQCSVLQCYTRIPSINQQIYWKGVEINNINKYIQLYWGTCF